MLEGASTHQNILPEADIQYIYIYMCAQPPLSVIPSVGQNVVRVFRTYSFMIMQVKYR